MNLGVLTFKVNLANKRELNRQGSCRSLQSYNEILKVGTDRTIQH